MSIGVIDRINTIGYAKFLNKSGMTYFDTSRDDHIKIATAIYKYARKFNERMQKENLVMMSDDYNLAILQMSKVLKFEVVNGIVAPLFYNPIIGVCGNLAMMNNVKASIIFTIMAEDANRIFVDEAFMLLSDNAKKFAILHELGHINNNNKESKEVIVKDIEIEILADAFATIACYENGIDPIAAFEELKEAIINHPYMSKPMKMDAKVELDIRSEQIAKTVKKLKED